MLRKIGQNFQIALPREIVKALGLKINDYLDIQVQNNKLVIEPQLVIPKDQAYFYTKEWQKNEAKADADIKKDRTTKTKNLKQLFDELDS